MKRILLGGALILGLVACGRDTAGGSNGGTDGSGGSGGSGGSTTYPYNPDASATESSDTRIPYRGDWVWAAKLSDGSYKLGVLVISKRAGTGPTAKNGGEGLNAPCADENCTSINVSDKDYGFGLISTQLPSSGPQLEALLGSPAGVSTLRLVMVDADNKVGKITINGQERAVLSGAGKWQEMQEARVAFVQLNSDENKEGVIDVTVSAAEVAQVKAAADTVSPQQIKAFSSLSLDSIRK